jgi:dienelactone hydrolase
MGRRFFTILLAAAGWLACGTVGAQPLDMQVFKRSAEQAPDLKLTTEAKEPSLFMSAPVLLKPAGEGPFPALVVYHTCGGVRSETFDWAKRAVAEGYVALVIDSLGPRGLKTNCIPPTSVPISRGVKDAYQALVHLQSLPFVDRDRIGLIGFSWGAMVGTLVSSAEVAQLMSPGPRYQASVAFYPMCYFKGMRGITTTFEYLRQDADRPLLVLMGDQDNETPPADCLPRLEQLKAKNAPVEWHLYPDTTHCWDCISVNGYRKVDFQGNNIVYRYRKDVTEDSGKRAFEFLAKAMPKR